MGAVELFDARGHALAENQTLNRQNIFLSEWAPGVVHSFNTWYMNDRTSSARWHTLLNRQTVTLFEHADGAGYQFNNIRA